MFFMFVGCRILAFHLRRCTHEKWKDCAQTYKLQILVNHSMNNVEKALYNMAQHLLFANQIYVIKDNAWRHFKGGIPKTKVSEIRMKSLLKLRPETGFHDRFFG